VIARCGFFPLFIDRHSETTFQIEKAVF